MYESRRSRNLFEPSLGSETPVMSPAGAAEQESGTSFYHYRPAGDINARPGQQGGFQFYHRAPLLMASLQLGIGFSEH